MGVSYCRIYAPVSMPRRYYIYADIICAPPTRKSPVSSLFSPAHQSGLPISNIEKLKADSAEKSDALISSVSP